MINLLWLQRYIKTIGTIGRAVDAGCNPYPFYAASSPGNKGNKHGKTKQTKPHEMSSTGITGTRPGTHTGMAYWYMTSMAYVLKVK